ncbi:MAG: lamin tail domain-containing protein [Bacteroidales bacterium]|nr:lamin tail domain-containing protein [Bacteroidales bacterium]
MKIPAVIFFILPLTLHAQLRETFECGNLDCWQQFPPDHWECSAVQPIQGRFSLHHGYNNSMPGFDRISFAHDPLYCDSLTTTWKFSILYSCFPSSQNNWSVYLLADRSAGYMNPNSNIRAYIAGVNLNGYDDLLKIYKVKNNRVETVVNSCFNWQTETSVLHATQIKIIRSTGGIWSILIDTTGSGKDFVFLDDGIDSEYSLSNYFGIGYRYTSTNDRKLWLDDLEITGCFKQDLEPPAIKKISVVSPNKINVEFTEAINTSELSLTMFSVNDEAVIPVILDIQSPASIALTFSGSFDSTREYEISITGIKDIYGNAQSILKNKFICYFAKPFDIIINEIMSDPEPAVNLPDVEYIELFNTTNYDIEALGWELAIGEKCISLPSFLISKNAYLIVCEASDSSMFKPFGTILPVRGFPALNNEGQTITLANSEKTIIHSVSYTSRWFKNPIKAEGGWSLEMIDAENPCAGYDNWEASDSYLGGTPGFENSVIHYNPDNTRPYLLRAATTCDTGLLVSFSEPLLHSSASDPNCYSVNQGIYHPVNAIPITPDFSTVLLSFPVKFESFRLYELMVKDKISDCYGNLLTSGYMGFGLASPPDSFDLVINEVLFNARDEEDFVEMLNRSDKIIELSSMKIVLLDEFTGIVNTILCELPFPIQLLPGQYLAVTGNAAVLQEQYYCKNPAAIFEATGMKALPDKTGVIALLDSTYQVIDKFLYRSDYHFNIISHTEGVSLERIHCNSPTNTSDNWHSAAEDEGFATPGYKNSQSFEPAESLPSSIWLEPEIFTPDNDGYDDYITLTYHFNNPGLMATIIVFDNRGNRVKQLANNTMLGTEGFFTWDGTNVKGLHEQAGIYVIYTEVFSDNGTIRKFRNICVLANKLK